MDSSSDESSLDKSSSDGEELVVEGGKGANIQVVLGDSDRVQLESEEQSFKPTWEKDAGGYLRGVRGFG